MSIHVSALPEDDSEHFHYDAERTLAWFRSILPFGYEIEFEEEGGQPNGAGIIEPNDTREWYTDERECAHRATFHIEGPWRKGPTRAQARIRAQREADRLRLAEEAEARRKKAEPDEALVDVAKGLYAAHRLKQGMETTVPWNKLRDSSRQTWLDSAREAVRPTGNPTSRFDDPDRFLDGALV